MKKRDFLKTTGLLALGAFLPSPIWAFSKNKRLRTAHIGVSGMGGSDLASISSHELVDVVALCDVDSNALEAAKNLHPNAEVFSDYRILLRDFKNNIDAVIVSTPDHTHAPASMMAMEMGKPVYCQKPLTHHVAEARSMHKLAERKNLVTQMGIQVHSFYDYKLATLLIQSGIIGRVKTVIAWSPKNQGYNGPEPQEADIVPQNLDWNLWLGTAKERAYKDKMYHPAKWRKILDYGSGTLGDMGVHIFDTPYNALQLDVPKTIINNCRKPTGFGYPENNTVTYEFPGTKYTADTLKWVWYDGPGAPKSHTDLELPNDEKLPEQGAMFVGEKGKLLLPHFMQLPRHIIGGEYVDLDLSVIKESDNLGKPTESYDQEGSKHYHQFVDACLGKDKCSAPFSYSARLTESILLGVIAGRFPNKKLHWDSEKAIFKEAEANKFLDGSYRDF